MKSERRHELQQNELDHELHELLRWFRRNASRIIGAAILVIGIAVAAALWIYNARAEAAAVQRQFTQTVVFPTAKLTEAEQLQQLQSLTEADDPRLAATAVLQIGHIHLMQAATVTTATEVANASERAALRFNQVIKDYSRFPDIVASAYYGLGREAEGREDWSDARQYYEKVVNMPELKGLPVVGLCRGAINQLPRLKDPVYLSNANPVNPLPMGPIKAVQAFFRVVELEENGKLPKMFVEDSAAPEAARLVRDLTGDEPPAVKASDVADEHALVLTRPVKEEDALRSLVFRMVRKGDGWKITSVQKATPQQARAKQNEFRREYPKALIDIEPMVAMDLGPDATEIEPVAADPNAVDANSPDPISPIEPIEPDANTPE